MGDIDVAALGAAAKAATPGPWEQLEHEPQQVDAADLPISESWLEQDAAYIAAANPAVVLALLDEVEALRDQARVMQSLIADVLHVHSLYSGMRAKNRDVRLGADAVLNTLMAVMQGNDIDEEQP